MTPCEVQLRDPATPVAGSRVSAYWWDVNRELQNCPLGCMCAVISTSKGMSPNSISVLTTVLKLKTSA
jgi:hypothetical protein